MIKSEWNKKVCSYAVYFKASEFECKCGKCKDTAFLDPKLITYLDELRIYFRKPVVITSGIRCKTYNNSLVGSSKTSGHLKGKAVDVFIKGVSPDAIADWWSSNVPGSICYFGTPNMGNCAHLEVI